MVNFLKKKSCYHGLNNKEMYTINHVSERNMAQSTLSVSLLKRPWLSWVGQYGKAIYIMLAAESEFIKETLVIVG